MKKWVGVVAGVAALGLAAAGSAQAQRYNWSGFYIGAHAGGAWSQLDFTYHNPFPDGAGLANSHDGGVVIWVNI